MRCSLRNHSAIPTFLAVCYFGPFEAVGSRWTLRSLRCPISTYKYVIITKLFMMISLMNYFAQHDALSVFDDVEQGTCLQEDIWISGVRHVYPSSSSVPPIPPKLHSFSPCAPNLLITPFANITPQSSSRHRQLFLSLLALHVLNLD